MLCGKAKATGSFIVVQGNALAVQIEVAEVEMRIRISLPCSTVEPFGGFLVVLGDTFTRGVTDTEVDLRSVMSPIGSLCIPSDGLGMVKRRSLSHRETSTKGKLCVCISILCALFE